MKYKTSERIAKFMRVAGPSTILVCLGLIGLELKSTHFSTRIKDEKELASLIESKKRDLNLEGKIISGKIVEPGFIDRGKPIPKDVGGFCTGTNYNDPTYKIYLVKGHGDTIDGLKHELYHIAKGHTEPLSLEDATPPFKKLFGSLFGEKAEDKFAEFYKSRVYDLRYLLKQEIPAQIYGATGIDLQKDTNKK